MDATVAPTSQQMARNAGEAARFLRAIGNESRLMVLCTLAEGECSVSGLLERVPLSQSALSQHLSVLRREGLVDTRREAQTIHYRLADTRVRQLMPVLYELFCTTADEHRSP
jgi:DNA-binding transcriptional ArsR family regulator